MQNKVKGEFQGVLVQEEATLTKTRSISNKDPILRQDLPTTKVHQIPPTKVLIMTEQKNELTAQSTPIMKKDTQSKTTVNIRRIVMR